MKKAQVAMESLMIYGAAILVVLLAIAALTYFGVLDLGRFLPEKCAIGGGILDCKEWTANSGINTVDLVLSNRAGKRLTIKEVAITNPEDNAVLCNLETTPCASPQPCVLENGESTSGQAQQYIELKCTSMPSKGNRMAGKLTVTYTTGVLDMDALGTITATVK